MTQKSPGSESGGLHAVVAAARREAQIDRNLTCPEAGAREARQEIDLEWTRNRGHRQVHFELNLNDSALAGLDKRRTPCKRECVRGSRDHQTLTDNLHEYGTRDCLREDLQPAFCAGCRYKRRRECSRRIPRF